MSTGTFPGKKAAEIKNTWSFTSSLPYVFKAWYLMKHRGISTLHDYVLVLWRVLVNQQNGLAIGISIVT